jgi:hypothetical protein
MKHVRADQTFVYYYVISRTTGDSRGLRFSQGTVAPFRGREDDPELIGVGQVWNLPVGPDDPSGDLYDMIAEVVQDHPEVTDLLSGRMRFDQVVLSTI